MRDPSTTPALTGRTVLVVEDEALILLDLRYALEAAGARMRLARGVDEALGEIARERPDAAIVDLTLEDRRDAGAVLERLVGEGVPTLLHSGDAPRHRALLERYELPLLTKPSPSERLLETLARLLADAESDAAR